MLNIRFVRSSKELPELPKSVPAREDLGGLFERVFKWDEAAHPRGKTTDVTNTGSFAPKEGGTADGTLPSASTGPKLSPLGTEESLRASLPDRIIGKHYETDAEVAKDYPRTQSGETMVEMSRDQSYVDQLTNKEPEGLDTQQQNATEIRRDADGRVIGVTLSPQRQALDARIHDAMLDEKNHQAQEKPQVFIMGGGGSAGKSTMLDQLDLPKDRVNVDVDLIRVEFPEWDAELLTAAREGRAPSVVLGSYTHEEASDISKRLAMSAIEKNFHMVLDGAGDGSIESLEKKVAGYRKDGRPVIANYATVDYDEAYDRMRKRGDKPGGPSSGRYIPAARMREVHSAVSRVFQDAVKRGLFDEFTLWDTTVPLGDKPIKVASGKGKNMVIHDQAAWDKFVERGKGIDPRPGEI